MALYGRERIILDGFMIGAGLSAAGWWAGRHAYDHTAYVLWAMSLLIVLITAYRAVVHRRPVGHFGPLGPEQTAPQIPPSQEVLRHAARESGSAPEA